MTNRLVQNRASIAREPASLQTPLLMILMEINGQLIDAAADSVPKVSCGLTNRHSNTAIA
jgi:hypothetical protein